MMVRHGLVHRGETGNLEIKPDANGTIAYDESNTLLYNEETVIYRGRYQTSSPFFEFEAQQVGRYMRITVFNNSKGWKDDWAWRSSFSQIYVGERIGQSKVIPSTFSQLSYSGSWSNTSDGYYYNGKAIVGSAGSDLVYDVPSQFKEFGIIGDLWEGMRTATVYLDSEKASSISSSMMRNGDTARLSVAHRSFRQVLFFAKLNDSKHTVRIHVDSGQIIINGILIDCTGNNCVIDNSDDYTAEVEAIDNGKSKSLTKSGTIAVAVVVVVAVVAAAVVMFFVGAKKGWWFRPPEDSDIMVDNFSI